MLITPTNPQTFPSAYVPPPVQPYIQAVVKMGVVNLVDRPNILHLNLMSDGSIRWASVDDES